MKGGTKHVLLGHDAGPSPGMPNWECVDGGHRMPPGGCISPRVMVASRNPRRLLGRAPIATGAAVWFTGALLYGRKRDRVPPDHSVRRVRDHGAGVLRRGH